jgi:tetratricopeptide (TPR) repeat protein
LFFYLVQISLVSNVILPLPGIVGERVLFIASLSFCVLIAFALDKFFGDAQKEEKIKPKRKSEPISFAFRANYLQLGLVASLLLFYSYETIARNSNWKDTITLFEADMPHLEKSAKANYMMAREIRRLYRTDKDLTPEKLQIESTKAIHYYHQAINAYPNYAMAIEELGMLYAIEQKNNSMAIPLFEKAFAIDSTLWRSANNLGMAFQISKDTLEAISWYEKSLKAKADNQKVVVELAKLYYLKGQKQKALACNDRLMKINPDSYLPYYNYAIYNMLEHDTANAIKYFEEDVKRGDQEKFPYFFLIKYYLDHRDTANAVRIRNFVPRVSR